MFEFFRTLTLPNFIPMKKTYLLIYISLFFFSKQINAQCSGWNNFQTTDSVFTNIAFGIATSPEADRLHRPYTYLAMVAGGVKVFDNNAAGNPVLYSTISKASLGNLDAINLYQDSIWLYVCLGNIWDTTQMAGLAIVDVSNPAIPNVLDVYVHTGLKGGAGAVSVKGNYAYLAANQNGLVILDISNKSNILFKSSLLLSNNFPHTTVGLTSMYNARGIDVKGNYAYVCFDRGGFRIIDISNVNAPAQINQYCFAPLIDNATAYNNVVVHNNLAYVAIDYYGMEVLDVSNPLNIIQLGWWHPADWTNATNNINTWASAVGHANEIAYDSICDKVYIAAGKSDIVAIDVNSPAMLATCEIDGVVTDDYGTWGLDFFDGNVYAAYIWSPFAPPYSNYTGYRITQTNCNPIAIAENMVIEKALLYPNPSSNIVHVNTLGQQVKRVKMFSITGELVKESNESDFSVTQLSSGIYFVHVQMDKANFITKFIKE